jgi:hypothetical protein
MTEPWDWKDFENLARVHMGKQQPPGATLPQIKAFIDEAFCHYEEATPEGKAFVDKLLLNTVTFLESKLEELPDTAEVRQMRRAIGLRRGKHLSAQVLVDRFPLLPAESDVRISEATDILCTTLQCLLDLLHDATQGLQDGAAKVSMLGLAYWLIDELIVAQFLARRGYATLAYSNLRTSLEILDKIELFTRFPELVELWAQGNDKEVWKNFAPPRVREKLGRDNLDPMYKYFSEEGSHATFKALQSRLRNKQLSPEDERRIMIVIGGIKDPARQVSILIYCILVSSQAIIKVANAFEEKLDPRDVTQLVTSTTRDCFAFFGRFLDSIDGSKEDITSLEVILESWRKMREDGHF